MTTYILPPDRRIYRADGSISVDMGDEVANVREVQTYAIGVAGNAATGTASYGIPTFAHDPVTNSQRWWVAYPDAIYNAIIASNPSAFAGCQIGNSVTTIQPLPLTPALLSGLHKQVSIIIGDSISAGISTQGPQVLFGSGVLFDSYKPSQPVAAFVGSISGTAPLSGQTGIGSVLTVTSMIGGTVRTAALLVDARGFIPPGTTIHDQISGTSGGVGTYVLREVIPNVPSITMYQNGGVSDYLAMFWHRDWTLPNSRVVCNASHSSWFMGPIPPATPVSYYDSVSGYVYNHDTFTHFPVLPNQQVVLTVMLGTNDFDSGLNHQLGSSNDIFGSPTQGDPNLVTGISGGQGGLTDIIAAFKAAYPAGKVCVRTIIARNNSVPEAFANAQFSNYADYIIANRATLGIDVIYDTRAIPQYACNSATLGTGAGDICNNKTYYVDDTHPTIFGANTLLNPPLKTMWDAMIAGNLSGLAAPMFYH